MGKSTKLVAVGNIRASISDWASAFGIGTNAIYAGAQTQETTVDQYIADRVRRPVRHGPLMVSRVVVAARLRDLGLSTTEIAEVVGVTKDVVAHDLVRAGRPASEDSSHPRWSRTETPKRELEALVNEEIKHARARSKSERVAKIVEMKSAGIGLAEIALQIGISHARVRQILKEAASATAGKRTRTNAEK